MTRLPPERPSYEYPDPVIIRTDEQFEAIKARTEEVISYKGIKLGEVTTKEIMNMEGTKLFIQW